jgi:S1-C subfamily serine protease
MPAPRPSRPLLLLACVAASAALVAGCSSGGNTAGHRGASGGGHGSASTNRHPPAAASGNHLTRAIPQGHAVCKGKAITDIVQQVEPSVVTVRTQKGLGSGIVYRKDVILTDQHVVAVNEGQPQTFSRVQVSLADGTTLTGKHLAAYVGR